MGMSIRVLLLACCTGCVFAQTSEQETKPAAVLELGGAASRDLKEGRSSYGPNVAVEITPSEKWLSIEMGVTPFRTGHSTEWDTGVVFRKPWNLTKKLEFMAGGGPAWVRSKENGVVANSVSLEASVHFMYWPSGKRTVGLFLEPLYEYNLAEGHERSVGIGAGLLFGIPRVHRGQSAIRQ
jgi:hypothetical protein